MSCCNTQPQRKIKKDDTSLCRRGSVSYIEDNPHRAEAHWEWVTPCISHPRHTSSQQYEIISLLRYSFAIFSFEEHASYYTFVSRIKLYISWGVRSSTARSFWDPWVGVPPPPPPPPPPPLLPPVPGGPPWGNCGK